MAGLTEQAKHRLRYQHEGLDTPEFLATPWVQPSRDKVCPTLASLQRGVYRQFLLPSFRLPPWLSLAAVLT